MIHAYMVQLTNTVAAWRTEYFEKTLIDEVTKLGVKHLPLQQGLTASSVALDHNIQIIVLNIKEQSTFLDIKLGIFYSGIISGCNCTDDPSKPDETNEYCEVLLNIDLSTCQTSIQLIYES